MIVADASIAVLALLNDGEARALVAREAVAVPHLADTEVAHAVRAQVRRRVIDAEDGALLLGRWRRLGLLRYATRGLLPRVWELRDNLSAYDATYVALAEALSCDLVTADARLAAAPGPSCAVSVVRA